VASCSSSSSCGSTPEPEPVPFIAAALAWGAVVATSLASVGNDALVSILFKVGGAQFTQDWGASIVGPTNEQVLKALGVVMVILIAKRQVNTVLDGIVYGAFVGLGFQVVEDLLYTLRGVSAATQAGASGTEQVWEYFVVRGLASGLYSHAVYTAIVGAGIAYFVVRTDRSLQRRVTVAAALFAASWFLHFGWNSRWLNELSTGTEHYVIVGSIKGFPALVLLVLLTGLPGGASRLVRCRTPGRGGVGDAGRVGNAASSKRDVLPAMPSGSDGWRRRTNAPATPAGASSGWSPVRAGDHSAVSRRSAGRCEAGARTALAGAPGPASP
jgi:RsiW-degrading membrane proteinase PrsW (M82 family)